MKDHTIIRPGDVVAIDALVALVTRIGDAGIYVDTRRGERGPYPLASVTRHWRPADGWIRTETDRPEPLADVLALRRDPHTGEPVPDLAYYGTDGAWYSSCSGCEERIDPPLAWYPTPCIEAQTA